MNERDGRYSTTFDPTKPNKPVESPEFILVQIGYFADGKGTPSYQLYRWNPEVMAYAVLQSHKNDPVPWEVASQRLKEVSK